MAHFEKRGEQPAQLPVLQGQTLPHDLNVERAVLSAMLREPARCVDEAVEYLGSGEEVFYSHVHRMLFSTILELHKTKPGSADTVAVAASLAKQGKLDAIGGEVFLAELFNEVPTTANLESWCGIVRGNAILRDMIDVCGRSLAKCYNPDNEVNSVIDQIENDIYQIRHKSTESHIVQLRESISTECKALFDMMTNHTEVGIKTGYNAIDELTGGLKKGEMFVLAARPSIGKTAFALNIVRNIILNPQRSRPVAFFSLEMTAEQISRRLLCSEANLSESLFWNHSVNPQDMPKLIKAVETFKDTKLFIDPTAGISIAELRAKARRLVAMEHIELIVIDYLQLMSADSRAASDSRQTAVAEISGGLKQIAKDLKIPILVLAQLNREVDKNAGPSTKPKLSHLRESGAIEQDADIVAFLHRDREKAKNLPPGQSTDADVIVEKNRNGQTGEVKMLFFPHRMRFEVASKYDEKDNPNRTPPAPAPAK